MHWKTSLAVRHVYSHKRDRKRLIWRHQNESLVSDIQGATPDFFLTELDRLSLYNKVNNCMYRIIILLNVSALQRSYE